MVHGLSHALQTVEQSNAMEYIEAVFTYLFRVGEVKDTANLWLAIHEILSHETGEKIMTIAEQLKAEGEKIGMLMGMEKGMEKGMEIGSHEEKKLLARKLIQNKLVTIQGAADLTGLSLEVVQKLVKIPSHIS